MIAVRYLRLIVLLQLNFSYIYETNKTETGMKYNEQHLFVGKKLGQDSYTPMLFTSFAIMERVLSPAEVKQLYVMGRFLVFSLNMLVYFSYL